METAESTDSAFNWAQWVINRYQTPVFVVDGSSTVIFRNSAAAAIVGAKSGFSIRSGKLRLGTKSAEETLQKVIAQHDSRNEVRVPCYGIRMARPDATRDWLLLVHVLQLPRSGRQMPTLFLVQAIGRVQPRVVPSQALQELFGLTKREIAVAIELLRSRALRTTARRLSLSPETVRSHLKRTFQKCNVHSQAELLALLQRISEFAASRP